MTRPQSPMGICMLVTPWHWESVKSLFFREIHIDRNDFLKAKPNERFKRMVAGGEVQTRIYDHLLLDPVASLKDWKSPLNPESIPAMKKAAVESPLAGAG